MFPIIAAQGDAVQTLLPRMARSISLKLCATLGSTSRDNPCHRIGGAHCIVAHLQDRPPEPKKPWSDVVHTHGLSRKFPSLSGPGELLSIFHLSAANVQVPA